MITLKLNIVENKIKLNKKFLTTGSHKSVECEFIFSQDWIELNKTAVFIMNNVTHTEAIINNKCFIPDGALEKAGTLKIGVFGIKTINNQLENRSTTNLTPIEVYEGSF